MKRLEMILGYATYNDNTYPFVYEKDMLNLLPGTLKEWEQQKSDLLTKLTQASNPQKTFRWIDNKYISGVTNEGKKILFISSGTGRNNNGFIQYDVQVIYEYHSDSVNEGSISGLIIKADEINHFFDPARVFESEIIFDDKMKGESISVKATQNSSNLKDCGTYNLGDLSVHIEASAYPTIATKSEKPLLAESQICLEFNKSVDLDKALEVIGHQQSFLKYISYRKNINLKSIDVIRRNENNLRRKEGIISIIQPCTYETNKKKSKQILSFELLEGNIAPIFQSISNGEIYLDHLCDSIDSKNKYDIARIIILFTAFESEYERFFELIPVRSEQYFEIKEGAIKLLNEYKESCPNRRTRDYVESFKNAINYNDKTLGSCIKKAISENLEIIKVFLDREYKIHDKGTINNIAQRLSSMRNHIAHGNLNLNIEPINISDLKILESLIYIMRLNSLEISNESIQKGICNLIGYNIYI